MWRTIKRVMYIPQKNLKYKTDTTQRKCEMKAYDQLKAEMEAIQQQMVVAKKNECTEKS